MKVRSASLILFHGISCQSEMIYLFLIQLFTILVLLLVYIITNINAFRRITSILTDNNIVA